MKFRFSLFAALVAVCVLLLFAAPSFAGDCRPLALQQSYAAPVVVPQAVVVPSALFVAPSAPTVQLQVQQYSYGVAQPVVVQPLVQKVQVQQFKAQRVQQVQVKPPVQRLRSVTRTRLFSR